MANDGSWTWPVPLTSEQEEKLAVFRELLVEWNGRMNLTAIIDEREVNVKHFYDSLAIADFSPWKERVEYGLRVIDVGTGAGFPGLPLAIAYPNCRFVLCDALAKRIRFLETVCSEIGLSNVECIHARSEDLGRQSGFRGAFDVAVSRAVAKMNVLMEYMAPFLKSGGFGVCYKGPSLSGDEASDGERAGKLLNVRVGIPLYYALPDDFGERSLVVFSQAGAVPKRFPRKPGVVQKQPL